jgi:hypothetical protein
MESSATLKKWGELSGKEEYDRLHALGQLLQKHDLSVIQPVSADHQAYLIKSAYSHTQSKLMIQGKVPTSQALNVINFNKEVQELLKDINPYTFLVRIDVQPVEIGE